MARAAEKAIGVGVALNIVGAHEPAASSTVQARRGDVCKLEGVGLAAYGTAVAVLLA